MEKFCRKYQQEDIEPLNRLIDEFGYNVDASEFRQNVHEICKRGGAIFVYEKDKQILGSICAVIDARFAEGVCAEIVSLIVSEGSRGQGIGKILIQAVEKWAGKRRKKIRVRANVIRTMAHEFYKNQGYLEKKSQKIFIRNM